MISHVLKFIALTISALTIGVLAGFAVSFAVFFLPVLLGQPMESMVGWGWFTSIPAIILGPAAGIATVAYLFRCFAAWGLLASPGTPLTGPRRVVVGVFATLPLALGALASHLPTRQYALDVADGYRHHQWVEQVTLGDGSTVTVERFERARRKSSQFRESSMAFRTPSGDVPAWSHPFEPQVLYEDEQNKELTIVAKLAYCEDYFEQGYPRALFLADRPPTLYLEFRLRRGKWVRVPLSPASIGQRPNLLGNAFAGNRSVISVDRESTNCGRTTYSAPIHDAEDAVLATLDRERAPAPVRQRAEEFLAGSRVLHERDVPASGWKPDDDPLTIQTVMNGHYNGGLSGVSPDGQVIYIGGRRPFNDESRWIAESYSRRMHAAGLGRYAPAEPQPVPP